MIDLSWLGFVALGALCVAAWTWGVLLFFPVPVRRVARAILQPPLLLLAAVSMVIASTTDTAPPASLLNTEQVLSIILAALCVTLAVLLVAQGIAAILPQEALARAETGRGPVFGVPHSPSAQP